MPTAIATAISAVLTVTAMLAATEEAAPEEAPTISSVAIISREGHSSDTNHANRHQFIYKQQ
jgi:hypothetical protein